MPKYVKAYPVGMLRRHPGWAASRRAERGPDAEETKEPHVASTLDDEEIVYLHEDGTVTRGLFEDDVVFEGTEPGWLEFCRESLGFQPPDWEAESKQVREHLSRTPSD